MKPLADKIRPKTLEEVFGQKHLIGDKKPLTSILKSGKVSNMIFYGPPGVGKTTVANIIAEATHRKLYKLNATSASTKDIKEIIADLDKITTEKGVLLYLDEIQHFNKKQQQSLLEYIENGKIVLIASTTENPYQYVYKAILSRSTVFEFKTLTEEDLEEAVKRAHKCLNEELKPSEFIVYDNLYKDIAMLANGDTRSAINILETLVSVSDIDKDGNFKVDKETLMNLVQNRKLDYDKMGDSHYNIISALQKSIRGSDPDAAIHYLARLVKAGDLLTICRRLLVIAAEDIGLAYPNAIVITKACVDSAMQLGFPEARIPLAEATVMLAIAPKSNSAYSALDKAINDLDNKEIGQVPNVLRDSNTVGQMAGYKYPHAYDNNYVKQQYLPDELKNEKYYDYGMNKTEQGFKNYWERIK